MDIVIFRMMDKCELSWFNRIMLCMQTLCFNIPRVVVLGIKSFCGPYLLNQLKEQLKYSGVVYF